MTFHAISLRARAVTVVSALVAAAGCAKAPPPPPAAPPPLTIAAPPEARVKTTLTIAADPDTNPDPSGRPSPVVVRVYQLRADAAFSKADFFSLYDDEQKVLGQELISRDEFRLSPSEQRTIDVAVADATRFVGAIAAYRDIRNAEWRGVLAAPKGGLVLRVERNRVVLAPAAN
jgi:type VI secretion system protein VasD